MENSAWLFYGALSSKGGREGQEDLYDVGNADSDVVFFSDEQDHIYCDRGFTRLSSRLLKADQTLTERYSSGNVLVNGERPAYFAVADGMGGHGGGDVASSTVLQTIRNNFQKIYSSNDSSDSSEKKVKDALRSVEDIFLDNLVAAEKDSSLKNFTENSGTTLSSIYFTDGNAVIANCGDSRVYRLREGDLQQLTEDDSHYKHGRQFLDIDGAICPDGKFNIHHLETDYQGGDVFYVVTDGLNKVFVNLIAEETKKKLFDQNGEIRQNLNHHDIEEVLDFTYQRIQSRASRYGEGQDNATLNMVVVQSESADRKNKRNKSQQSGLLSSIKSAASDISSYVSGAVEGLVDGLFGFSTSEMAIGASLAYLVMATPACYTMASKSCSNDNVIQTSPIENNLSALENLVNIYKQEIGFSRGGIYTAKNDITSSRITRKLDWCIGTGTNPIKRGIESGHIALVNITNDQVNPSVNREGDRLALIIDQKFYQK